MNLMGLIANPVAQALWDGVKYTAPKVIKAIQQQSAPRPVTEADIKQAAAETAQPDFSDGVSDTPYTEISNESET